MTIARILPALAALAAGAGVVALVPPRAGVTPFEIAAALAVGWSFVASGLIASHRRPENRIGQVMVFTGFAWFAGHLAWSSVPALFTAGTLVEALHLLGVGYLLLTFPSGRLDSSVAPATRLAGGGILGP